jgi:uncharacterized phage protein (TIGR01671 family)
MKTSEIRFRGKLLNSKKWIEGSLLKAGNGEVFIYNNTGDLSDFEFRKAFIQVKPETIGQFTGLQDKNGVDLFKDDIIKHYDKRKAHGVIRWYDGSFWVCPEGGSKYTLYNASSKTILVKNYLADYEKIGTKFDNKTK